MAKFEIIKPKNPYAIAEERWQNAYKYCISRENKIRFCYHVSGDTEPPHKTWKNLFAWCRRGIDLGRSLDYSGPPDVLEKLGIMAWESHLLQRAYGQADWDCSGNS